MDAETEMKYMKKTLAVLAALCLALSCASAAAEAETAETFAAPTIGLDGFYLVLRRGELYIQQNRVAKQPYVTIYPFYAEEDPGTNCNVVWMGKPFSATVDYVKEGIAETEDTVRRNLEAEGYRMSGFAAEEPYESALNGVPCVVLNYQFNLEAGEAAVVFCEREIWIGEKGYCFTISADSPENVEAVFARLEDSLKWY